MTPASRWKRFPARAQSKTAARLRRWRARARPGTLILMYHRVAKIARDPWGICVSPSRFEEQLAVLARYNVLPMRDVAAHGRGQGRTNRWFQRTVAVTFDDGFADNARVALPLLERYHVPATFFLASGCIGRAREFWWDALEQLVLEPETVPARLRLAIAGEEFAWELESASRLSLEERDRAWLAWESAPTARHALFYELWQRLIVLPEAEQNAALDALSHWADRPLLNRASHLTMSLEEARTLARSPVSSIGGHTVSHPALPCFPVDEQERQIREGRAQLQELLNCDVEGFSYPYGRQDERTRAIVQNAGFAWACTTESDLARGGQDAFALPRLQVGDWNAAEFERQLRFYLEEHHVS